MRICTISNGNCFAELGIESMPPDRAYYSATIAPAREVFDAIERLGGAQLAITYGERFRTGELAEHRLMEIPAVARGGPLLKRVSARLGKNILPILKMLRSFRPEFIISIDGWTYRHLVPLLFCLLSPARLVLALTSEYSELVAGRGMRGLLARSLLLAARLRKIHLVGVRSREVSSQLGATGLNPEKLRVLYPYFGSYKQWSSQEIGNGERDGTTVLFIGRLVEEKRPLFFVELANRLSRSGAHEAIRFRLIGEGPLGSAVRSRIAELRLTDAVSMSGYLNPREVFESLCAADLLVIPSRCESFGKVAVEAMIAGIPVVASRVGGLTDIIVDGDNGFLCEFGDIACFEKRILEILDAPEPAGGMREQIQRHRETWLSRESSFGKLIEELCSGATTNGAR